MEGLAVVGIVMSLGSFIMIWETWFDVRDIRRVVHRLEERENARDKIR